MQQVRFSPDFPTVLYPQDLGKMTIAAATAIERLANEGVEVENEAVARVVFHLYRRGLVEPQKLADVAVLFAHSKLVRGQ